ncbi:MAG: HAMP domain-containing sensor histidine kinase [Candidatus Limnocylindria bacterium]|nr:HAMP domain-containing sensor histidine kinase [Candidatus Limnocylindria bacterium]
MTLRRRLALWYGVLISVVVGTAFTMVYLVHTRAHDDDLDAALSAFARSTVADVRLSLSLGTAVDDLRVSALHPAAEEPHAIWLFVDGREAPLVTAGPASDAAFVDADVTALQDGFRTSWTEPGRVRALAVPVEGAGRVVVAANLRGMDNDNAQLRGNLAFLGILAIAFGLGGAWAVAGSALRPVAELTATAEEVTRSHDPSRRVRTRTASDDDELSRLGRTFNAMLASLEEAYLAEHRFVSDVSHEIRTPLTTIRGNAELLASASAGATPEEREAVTQIVREAGRLSRLVHDLLAIARADAGPQPLAARPFQLDEVVMEAFEELRGQPGAPIRVSALDQATIAGERDRVKEVLLALLDNARRYTPADGSIDVSLRTDEGAAIVNVEDSGIGVAPEDAARAFDRFWRSDQARRRDPTGSGLGLAIAKWIVERHGGTIALEPRSPRGARATVRLPLATVAALPAADAGQAPAPDDGRRAPLRQGPTDV